MNKDELLSHIVTYASEQIREMNEEIGEDGTLYETEKAIHHALKEMGRYWQQALIEARGTGLSEPERPCECGGRQIYQGQAHPLTQQTSFGEVTWKKRACYQCEQCGHRTYPIDTRWGRMETGKMSAYLSEQCAWLTALMPYEQVGQTLERFHWPCLSRSQIWKASQQVAQQVLRAEAERQQERESGDGQPACRAESSHLYVVMDGFQYCSNERTETGYQWREMKTAATYDVVPSTQPATEVRQRIATMVDVPCPPEDQAKTCRYVVGTQSWEQFGPVVWGEAWERGLEDDDRELIVVADGAPAIDQLVNLHLHIPGRPLTRILDYGHAQQHLWAVARLAFAEEALAWMQEVGVALELGQIDEVLMHLHEIWQSECLERPAVAHAADVAYHYFDQRAWQTDYPSFVAHGYQIGSGVAESTCKRFGTDRMKGTGMRWSVPGAHHVATLRAMLLSKRWPEVSSLFRTAA